MLYVFTSPTDDSIQIHLNLMPVVLTPYNSLSIMEDLSGHIFNGRLDFALNTVL